MKIERKPSTALLPTPVVLLSVAGHGKEKPNIITLAWAGTVCSDPPMLSVAIRPSRHSHRLVNAAREFVVNVPRAEQLEQVDLAGVWSGAEHDKFEELGLTARPANAVAAPLIEECPINIECVVRHQLAARRARPVHRRDRRRGLRRGRSRRPRARSHEHAQPRRLRRGGVLVSRRAHRVLRRRGESLGQALNRPRLPPDARAARLGPVSFYITTPIYYVNGEPHHGHAYTTVAADVLARFHRQRGEDVFFLTGTDEHGTKVAQAAEERGLTPQQHVDQLAPRYRELAAALGASNDFFIRTTDPEHEAFVQGFVEKLRAAGDIEKRSYGGLYCTACEAFWYERDLTAEGLCPDHGVKPVWLEEENYYFLLSRYQDRLADFFRANPGFVKPKSRFNEALSFIEQGLEDISISRSSITWGVSVPWDDEQVIYVWVDALINYLSALTYARPGEDLTARYWPAFHLLAKDILKFHAVIWPALLMSAGYDLPTGELIHGYLLVGGEKMSKTRGNVLDPFAVIEEVGAEPLRYYLMREVTLGQDGDVSMDGLRARYNNELANELGNLVSRTVSMIGKYRDGAIPQAGPEGEALAAVAAEGEAMVAKAAEQYAALSVTAALDTIWEYVRRLNKLVEEEAPWKLAKDEALARRLDAVLNGLAAGLRLVALAVYPVIPVTAVEVLRRLGQAHGDADLLAEKATWAALTSATVVAGPPLFPRLESAG